MSAGRLLSRPAGFALVTLGVVAILLATLKPGDPSILQVTPLTCLVCGATGMVDVWRNVVLFLPFGTGLGLLGVKPGRAVLAGLLLSLTVETLQLTVIGGRDPSLSDLLTNTTGTGLSALLVHHWRGWLLPAPAGARRLAVAAGGLWLAALALTGAGLQWSGGEGPYLVNVLPPTQGAMRAFEGTVHTATLNGVPVATGQRASPVHPEHPGDTLRLHARVTPSYAPGTLRPVIWLFGPGWSEVLAFGQRHRSLVVRPRTASADVRFSSPTFHLPAAFPAEPAVVELTAEVTPRALLLRSVRGDGDEVVVRIPKRLSLGWMLALPQGTMVSRPALVSALWLALLAAPLAYWSTMASRTRAGRGLALVVMGLVVATGPVAFTAVYELAPLGAADWLGAVAGLAAGTVLARITPRVARRLGDSPRPAG